MALANAGISGGPSRRSAILALGGSGGDLSGLSDLSAGRGGSSGGRRPLSADHAARVHAFLNKTPGSSTRASSPTAFRPDYLSWLKTKGGTNPHDMAQRQAYTDQTGFGAMLSDTRPFRPDYLSWLKTKGGTNPYDMAQRQAYTDQTGFGAMLSDTRQLGVNALAPTLANSPTPSSGVVFDYGHGADVPTGPFGAPVLRPQPSLVPGPRPPAFGGWDPVREEQRIAFGGGPFGAPTMPHASPIIPGSERGGGGGRGYAWDSDAAGSSLGGRGQTYDALRSGRWQRVDMTPNSALQTLLKATFTGPFGSIYSGALAGGIGALGGGAAAAAPAPFVSMSGSTPLSSIVSAGAGAAGVGNVARLATGAPLTLGSAAGAGLDLASLGLRAYRMANPSGSTPSSTPGTRRPLSASQAALVRAHLAQRAMPVAA